MDGFPYLLQGPDPQTPKQIFDMYNIHCELVLSVNMLQNLPHQKLMVSAMSRTRFAAKLVKTRPNKLVSAGEVGWSPRLIGQSAFIPRIQIGGSYLCQSNPQVVSLL